MNTTTKLMTLLLALILPATVFALPPYSYTNYEFAVDGIYYKIVDNEACVTYQEYRSGMHLSDYHGDVVIPAQVTYQDVTYPVTTIDYYAFNYCQGLTSITIPESITTIKDNAFYLCTRLTCVNLLTPTVVIEKYAFSMCSALTTITCPLTTPPAMYYEECFDRPHYESATLYVPASAVESYSNAPVWKKFVHIQAIETHPGDEDGYEYVPFVREGVKWVFYYDNSDDIINPSYEPGKHYFNLELKGDTIINGKTYKAMHKYSGSSINWENDTIPVYLREEDKIVYGIIPDGQEYTDCPVGNTFDDFYNGQEFVLYDFVDPVTFWDNYLNIGWQDIFYYQSTDTISLGNQFAKRYFWKDIKMMDFYQVEGVGADSEFNGYTLFPYKDIYADSMNVYFYLSHVIENGRIIYKGIHYIPGDVNHDGEVNIADANSVIDVVVMGGNAGHTRAPEVDMNGDGEVNIADVNAIIDLIIRNY